MKFNFDRSTLYFDDADSVSETLRKVARSSAVGFGDAGIERRKVHDMARG